MTAPLAELWIFTSAYELMLGSDTSTLRIFAKDIGRNRHLFGDVRLSHGKNNTMSDEELTITAMTSEEFSETNMLRNVNILLIEYI